MCGANFWCCCGQTRPFHLVLTECMTDSVGGLKDISETPTDVIIIFPRWPTGCQTSTKPTLIYVHCFLCKNWESLGFNLNFYAFVFLIPFTFVFWIDLFASFNSLSSRQIEGFIQNIWSYLPWKKSQKIYLCSTCYKMILPDHVQNFLIYKIFLRNLLRVEVYPDGQESFFHLFCCFQFLSMCELAKIQFNPRPSLSLLIARISQQVQL